MTEHRVQPPPTLPAGKAFVVQFAADAGLHGASCWGRIEHLISGRRLRFNSADELVDALGRLLDEIAAGE